MAPGAGVTGRRPIGPSSADFGHGSNAWHEPRLEAAAGVARSDVMALIVGGWFALLPYQGDIDQPLMGISSIPMSGGAV